MRRALVDYDNTHIEVNIDRLDIEQSMCCLPNVRLSGSMVQPGNTFKPTPKTINVTGVRRVIFNDPATVVYWDDGTRTVVKCQPGDTFDQKIGFLMAVCKRMCGNTGRFNELLKEFVPGYGAKVTPSVEDMRKKLDKYCTGRSCYDCPLEVKTTCRCGFGTSFLVKRCNNEYDMTDEEIIDAYKIVFGRK